MGGGQGAVSEVGSGLWAVGEVAQPLGSAF